MIEKSQSLINQVISSNQKLFELESAVESLNPLLIRSLVQMADWINIDKVQKSSQSLINQVISSNSQVRYNDRNYQSQSLINQVISSNFLGLRKR